MVKVVWRKSALKQLNEDYNYIKLDSFESAHKVREAIFDIAEYLASKPERFPIDEYKQSNKGDIEPLNIQIESSLPNHKARNKNSKSKAY